MKDFNIQEEMKNKIPKIEEESKYIISKLLEDIKKYHPYDLLSKYMSFITMNSTLNPFDTSNDVELKFGLEAMEMLMTCIDESDFENKEMNDSDFFEIVNNVKRLFELESQYSMCISFNFADELKVEGEYIFENIISMNITGKRYPYFENIHHKKILKPVESDLMELYKITLEDIINGLDKLRYKYMYGFKDAMDGLEKLMIECDDEQAIIEKQEEIERIIGEAFLLENHNVKKETNWNEKFIEIFSNKLGDNKDFCNNISIINFIKLWNTIKSKPIIKIENDYYILSISRLLDDLDKNILKDIYRIKDAEKERIKKEVAQNCEVYTAELFRNILPNSTINVNNYYKVGKNYIENDLLIEYDKFLLIIEIKAGNFTPEIAITDIESHKKTLHDLVEKADLQSDRFLNQLKENGKIRIYDNNNKKAKLKKEIDYSKFDKIFKIIVTLEGFNEITARAEKIGILKIHNNTIVCSIDDLEVYSDYFKNSPVEFIHYLMQRFKSTESSLIELNDELDHLGLYVDNNDYSLTASNMIKGYKDVSNIIWEEPRNEIDEYYKNKGINDNLIKPKQKLPIHLNEILEYLNNHYVVNSVRFFSEILECNQKGREEFEKYINEMISFYKRNRRPKYAGIKLNKMLFITCIVGNRDYDLNYLLEDFYANMIIGKEESAYGIILVYDLDEKLYDIKICDLNYNDELYKSRKVEEVADKLREKRVNRILTNRKIGRNEKCPCGSNLKYKKCCGKNIWAL